jgi:hypothetical protein
MGLCASRCVPDNSRRQMFTSVKFRLYARRFRCCEMHPARVNLSVKAVDAGIVTLPSLAVGPIRVESLPVMTEDLSVFQKMTGCRVDGIVGLDVLRQSSFVIDNQGKEIHFGHPERLPFSTPFETEEAVVTVRSDTSRKPPITFGR